MIKMSDGFDEMSPELKAQVRDTILFCSDTGSSKVFLKNCVQKAFPDLDKRAIYRTIKEMIQNGDLFYDGSLLKSPMFYPNTYARKYKPFYEAPGIEERKARQELDAQLKAEDEELFAKWDAMSQK